MKQRAFKLITFTCKESIRDILIAKLSLIGYDSFLITDNGFEVSILNKEFHKPSIDSIVEMLHESQSIRYHVKDIREKNWNIEWERNYNPIVVEDYCHVRATFHKTDKSYPLEIVIDPKMSFGTGHHDTTYLMIQHQIGLNHKDKIVLDAGCGTGILSILAEKLGAAQIIGLDIDRWAFDNAKENLQLNTCKKTSIVHGNIKNIQSESLFDIILANINLNVIVNEIKVYFNFLSPGGFIILSGFYSNDYATVNKVAYDIGFILHKKTVRNNWLSLVYYKKPD